jgi:hypothetical protein
LACRVEGERDGAGEFVGGRGDQLIVELEELFPVGLSTGFAGGHAGDAA